MSKKNENLKPESTPDWSFMQSLNLDCLMLGKERDKHPGNLSFGPQYHIKTSVGEQIDLSILSYDTFYPGRRLRNYYVFAIQPQLGIVARKNLSINFEKNSIITSGRLVTAYRGKGYGTALELVQADILQKQANQNGEIVWVITDQNNEFLFFAEKEHREKPTDSTHLALERAKTEHDRWRSIYDRFQGEYYQDPYKPKYVVRFRPMIPDPPR